MSNDKRWIFWTLFSHIGRLRKSNVARSPSRLKQFTLIKKMRRYRNYCDDLSFTLFWTWFLEYEERN